MRALVQRVAEAGVSVGSGEIAAIGPGLLVLLGVERGDSEAEADYLARRIATLRVFEDADGKMNLSLLDSSGGQFILCRRFAGRPAGLLPRRAARLEVAYFCISLEGHGVGLPDGGPPGQRRPGYNLVRH